MRILVAGGRNERGATATLVAVLAVALVGIGAFSLDFGQAYVAKRQLQTAADAAALAAAGVYATDKGDCTALSALPKADAETAALQVLHQNLADAIPEPTTDPLQVACSPTGKSLDVTISATTTTPAVLGGVFGEKTITMARSATAQVSVPNGSVGLRPYLICNFYVPNPVSPTTITKVSYPTKSDDSSACPNPGGNWFTLDCPHQGKSNNGNPGLAASTLKGCDHLVSVVRPQDATSKASLYSSLVAACPSDVGLLADYDPDCLSANPGNIGSGNVNDPSTVDGAWKAIVGTKGLFPVFCGTDNCNPVGYVADKNGNNAMYPVYKLVGAEICGWHWGSQNSGKYVSSDPNDACNGADASSGSSNENYLLLAFSLVLTSGGTDDVPACALGGTCDGLARTIYLAK